MSAFKHQITASMAKDIAFKLGAELSNEEVEIFADGYNAAMQSFGNSEQLDFPAIPDGYALVPVEPTDEMIVAAMDSDDVTYNESDDTVFYVHHREIYKAMLAAAPQQETANL